MPGHNLTDARTHPHACTGVKSDHVKTVERLAAAEKEAAAARDALERLRVRAAEAEGDAAAAGKRKDAALAREAAAAAAQRALHAAIRQVPGGGEHDGVGLLLRMTSGQIFIKSITPGGPAASCGLQPEDEVLEAFARHPCAASVHATRVCAWKNDRTRVRS